MAYGSVLLYCRVRGPSVVEALVRAGRRVLALDARGHGASGKPHDLGFYGEDKMAADLRQFFDLSGAHQMDLVGYSMGGAVALLTASQDARVRRLVVGGVGAGLVERNGQCTQAAAQSTIAAALRASDGASIQDPIAVRFRALADYVGTDREALAVCPRCARRCPGRGPGHPRLTIRGVVRSLLLERPVDKVAEHLPGHSH